MSVVDLSSWFKALGDPVRLRILHLLTREELSVGELVRILDLPQSTVSRHLKSLRESGLATDRPAGPATYYQAALETGNGSDEGGVRAALASQLREDPPPPADREGLERVLALREADGGAFFDRIGPRWDGLRESCFGPQFHLEAFVHLLPSDWTVADLGSGTGYLLPPLARHFRRVIGVDLSQPMLDLSERRIEEESLANVDLRRGRLEALPIEDSEIDLAVALLMFHHLEDVGAALGEIRRALNAGGRLLAVEIHAHTNERFSARNADRRLGIDPKELGRLLAESGFAIDKQWDFPFVERPEHELAPLPRLYGMIGRKNCHKKHEKTRKKYRERER